MKLKSLFSFLKTCILLCQLSSSTLNFHNIFCAFLFFNRGQTSVAELLRTIAEFGFVHNEISTQLPNKCNHIRLKLFKFGNWALMRAILEHPASAFLPSTKIGLIHAEPQKSRIQCSCCSLNWLEHFSKPPWFRDRKNGIWRKGVLLNNLARFF